MISVKSALQKVNEKIERSSFSEVLTENALGHILAQDVFSPINMPPFDQSAMDGYALGDIFSNQYTVIAEVKAGDSSEAIQLKNGEAARIFTGGMVPQGSVVVAKQEIVEREGDVISLTEKVNIGANIRPKGEQINKGELALSEGILIDAGSVGYLYGIGIDTVSVFAKPKTIIIATGNELTKPGLPLAPGKIYESNTYTLKAAFQQIGIKASINTVKDDYESTENMINDALNSYDLVVMTGGISVGDYDFVGKALGELEVEQVFYKVKQKPGKPVYLGVKKGATIFGLPGNPAAALSCFYMYVIPAVRKIQGFKDLFLEKRTLSLINSYKKTSNLSHFLKAFYSGDDVEILNSQSSAMLSSFAIANCILYMQENKEVWEVGDKVEAYIFP